MKGKSEKGGAGAAGAIKFAEGANASASDMGYGPSENGAPPEGKFGYAENENYG